MTTTLSESEIHPAARGQEASVVWFVNSLGYGSQLLYWGAILPGYLNAFPETRFFTTVDGDKPIPGTNQIVRQVPSWLCRLGRRPESYDRKISIVPPWGMTRIKKCRPSLVIISEFTMPSLYVVLLRRWLKTRVLLLVESDPLRGNPHRIGRWGRRLRRFVSHRADLILTNNRPGARYLVETIGVPATKVLQSPYVVSQGNARRTDEAACKKLRMRYNVGNRVLFLYVGQMIARKGIRQLIRAVQRLDKSDRDRVAVWLVGDGDERQALSQQIADSGLSDCLQMIGPVAYADLATYYQAADVFVMPTLDDYRALVGFEALGFGLPILHSIYDGAAAEVVVEGENGWRFDPRDCDDFSEKLSRFLQQVDRLGDMGHVSAELSESFTVNAAVDSLVTATRRCLAT